MQESLLYKRSNVSVDIRTMNKRNTILLFAGFSCLLYFGYFLWETLRYALFWREQQQLFLFDRFYIVETLFRPGGFSALSGSFLVQFFYSPVLAVVLTLILLGLITLLVWLTVRKMGKLLPVYPLCFLPALFLVLSLYDICYRYEAVTAYLFAVLALFVYSRPRRLDWRLRLILGSSFILILSYAAGSVAVLFSVSIFLYDILMRRDHASFSLLYFLLFLLVGYVSVRVGESGTYTYACSPLYYYEMGETMPYVHCLSWLMLPLCLLIAGIFRLRCGGRRLPVVINLALFALALFLFVGKYREVRDPNLHDSYRYEYLAVNEQWDRLVDETSANLHTGTALNYLNLALAQQGVLAERLFNYPQYGPNSLIFISKDKTPDVKLARILFAMGNMAAAQNVAFNACFTAGGYNPSMLKMILQIDLMRGAYPVALKYIELLEKSMHYSAWAASQRKYLFDDQAVNADPFLGTGRRDFPQEEAFVLSTTPLDDLYRTLDANPADGKAMQYALSYLLLSKDIDRLGSFIRRYYGMPSLSSLPLPVQEALLFCQDYYQTMDEEYALRNGLEERRSLALRLLTDDFLYGHGVAGETMTRFRSFRSAYGKARQDPEALSAYKNTFWYYLLFIRI